MIGRLKQVMAGITKKLDPYYHPDLHDYDQDYDDAGIPILPQFGKTELDAKKEYNFYNFCLYTVAKPSTKASKDPKATFQKMWPQIIRLYNKLKQVEGNKYIWYKFLEKISGRNKPKLTLEEQKFLYKHKLTAPSFIWEFISGNDKQFNLNGSMFLDTTLDLYRYESLPLGGRIAQTIPELLLITFHATIKQQCLAMSMNLDKFFTFIKMFIGDKTIQSWTRQGLVYRIGSTTEKRKVYPATTDISGIFNFISTWNKMDYNNTEVFYGKTTYFDLETYINFIRAKLDFDMYNDNEHEILIYKGSVLPNKFKILYYSSYHGYVLDEVKDEVKRFLDNAKISYTLVQDIPKEK